MSARSFALSVEMPDDEPRQIVCTGEEAGADIWQPAFGVWEADDFGIDREEGVGDGERLYVSRRIYDALNTRLADAEAMAEALGKLTEWIEGCRSSGDWGNWDWKTDDEYSMAVAAREAWEAGR